MGAGAIGAAVSEFTHPGDEGFGSLNPRRLDLPCDVPGIWSKVAEASAGPAPTNVREFTMMIASWGTIELEDIEGGASGLEGALEGRSGGSDITERFFSTCLPAIMQSALRLPALAQNHFPDGIPILHQIRPGEPPVSELALPRALVHSILANMFICTFPRDPREAMPPRWFWSLHSAHRDCTQEMAKLRMFIHYFERTGDGESLTGFLRLARQRIDTPTEQWAQSKATLTSVTVVPPMIGFEDETWGKDCLHADFANMYLGGGVLTEGCVQEEIRFSICPELTACICLTPVMLDEESIQILGAEQFSSYDGYAFGLRYRDAYEDPSTRNSEGTVLNGISAIDAMDYRGWEDTALEKQLSVEHILRELNKATAGFKGATEDFRRAFSCVATGNWGCGAFGGFVELKAVLQWMAASEGGITLRYFPFDEPFGPRLDAFCQDLVRHGVTVGQLFRALEQNQGNHHSWYQAGQFLEGLAAAVKQILSIDSGDHIPAAVATEDITPGTAAEGTAPQVDMAAAATPASANTTQAAPASASGSASLTLPQAQLGPGG